MNEDKRCFFEIVGVVIIVFIVLNIVFFFFAMGAKKWDEKLVTQDMKKVEAAIEDGYDVYLEGELKDAKTLDLAQYEISIDDENKIVKLTRENRENTDEIRPVYVMPFFH